jgi:serine/threonine protein kinase
MKKFAIKIY